LKTKPKTPALLPRERNAFDHEGLNFYAWPMGSLGWWAFGFMMVAANPWIEETAGGLVLLLAPPSLVYAFFGWRRRLHLMEGFLVLRIHGRERRWKWSELDAILLDHTRGWRRPVISFQTKAEGRIYLVGPWNVDEMTVHTAVRFAKAAWGRTGSIPSSP